MLCLLWILLLSASLGRRAAASGPARSRAAAFPHVVGRRGGLGRSPSYAPGGEAVTPSDNRLRALLDATMAIGSELSFESLLQRLVTTAADLTGANYAALGVID